MRWLLWCFCLLAESYETLNHYHYHWQVVGTQFNFLFHFCLLMFSLARHLHYSRFQHSIQSIKLFQQSFFNKSFFQLDCSSLIFAGSGLKVLFIYLFDDNLATGGSLTGATLSCHVELSKYSASKLQKKTNKRKSKTLFYYNLL